ncbi:hypothetical protein [Amycolatopsis nigrescens]|uniref:hypothetical protein n=1 Tax=Amycolatopsis nigrescens TaxID=381445 RepID=UPI00036456DA|nr:hypothetical protein [Amycolatopsis nigrescens]
MQAACAGWFVFEGLDHADEVGAGPGNPGYEPGWIFDFNPTTADLTVTTPTGRTYTTRPAPLVEPAAPSSKTDDEPPPF